MRDIAVDRTPSGVPLRRGQTRRRVMGGVAGLVGLVAAACGVGGQANSAAAPAKLTQPASLLFWSILGGADGTRMHDMTQTYVKETPLVQIEDIQGVPDFIQKFIASSVAGSPPDVVWIRQTYIMADIWKRASHPIPYPSGQGSLD